MENDPIYVFFTLLVGSPSYLFEAWLFSTHLVNRLCCDIMTGV